MVKKFQAAKKPKNLWFDKFNDVNVDRQRTWSIAECMNLFPLTIQRVRQISPAQPPWFKFPQINHPAPRKRFSGATEPVLEDYCTGH